MSRTYCLSNGGEGTGLINIEEHGENHRVMARASSENDAYRIVDALNAHDALVAALESLGTSDIKDHHPCWCLTYPSYSHTDECLAARAALKLAKEGQP